MGRLGNFLFEAATAYAYALKHDLDFTVPNKTNDPYWNPLYLQHLVKPMQSKATIRLVESGHQYQHLRYEPWMKDNWNIILQGYWQSEKYFKDYREEILKAFNYPWNPHNNVSIHVRRGDYLKYPHKHPVVPNEFYIKAIDYFYLQGFTDFYIFSDDIPWCKEKFINVEGAAIKFHFPDSSFVLNNAHKHGTFEEADLVGISNCAGGHINSSSTFAWWGAWLNRNPQKIVITPKLWFVPGHGGLDTSDIIPESWIKI